MKLFLGICAISILALAVVPEEVSAEDRILAKLTHDFNGGNELKSYPMKASEELGQAEILSKKIYGFLSSDIKTPATVFGCVWREIAHTSDEIRIDDVAPSEIFVSCMFGPKNVENPKVLGELGKLIYSDDWASLRATWKFEGGEFRLSRFDVEIQSGSMSYPPGNIRPDLSQIKVVENEMSFPANSSDLFEFNISAQLPYSNNFGKPKEDIIISITLSGAAEPIPKWLNY